MRPPRKKPRYPGNSAVLILSLLLCAAAAIKAPASGLLPASTGAPPTAGSAPLAPQVPRALGTAGIILLAHGGTPPWEDEVLKLKRALKGAYPTAVAFGMADTRTIQQAIDEISKENVNRLIVVPLFVCSYSSILSHTRYVLGLSPNPSTELMRDLRRVERAGHSHSISMDRIRTRLPLVLTPALDSHPLAAEIILDRAKTLSRDPGRETLFLIGHGPVSEADNRRWLEVMSRLGKGINALARRQNLQPFKTIISGTLRDDAPATVKERARGLLRAQLRAAGKNSRVIVVPCLIAQGGIESRIGEALKGLPYLWNGQTFAPHPNLERWVMEMAREAERAESKRRDDPAADGFQGAPSPTEKL
ncbi:MAG: hypothetical protein HY611_05600 [Elusimicrobia bacterium]|nr:hypothetical protein [Elusimicrobiota bacterium]